MTASLIVGHGKTFNKIYKYRARGWNGWTGWTWWAGWTGTFYDGIKNVLRIFGHRVLYKDVIVLKIQSVS